MIHPLADEILEQLWKNKEDGLVVQTARDLRVHGEPDQVRSAVAALAAAALVRSEPLIELLPEGADRARGIIRRHRLAEVLFSEVLGANKDEAEESACEFEHILSESVVDRVCAFLGHPPKCPHGHPVPPGDCCKKFERRIEPLIERLVDVEVGGEGTIAFIAPDSAARLTRLATLGIAAGSTIRLMQKKPAVVIRCGETAVALEDAIAREIYVRKAS